MSLLRVAHPPGSKLQMPQRSGTELRDASTRTPRCSSSNTTILLVESASPGLRCVHWLPGVLALSTQIISGIFTGPAYDWECRPLLIDDEGLRVTRNA